MSTADELIRVDFNPCNACGPVSAKFGPRVSLLQARRAVLIILFLLAVQTLNLKILTQQYKGLGHVVGMTCSSEWTLAQELQLPYVLTCAVSPQTLDPSPYHHKSYTPDPSERGGNTLKGVKDFSCEATAVIWP